MKYTRYFTLLFICFFLLSCAKKEKSILVFSKTAGYRHESIAAGIDALKKLGDQQGIEVLATEDVAYFTEDSLKSFDAVVFHNTTGDLLNAVQQADFERYIQAGGGFVGIHAATDTEYHWPWYNQLVGAYFMNHPQVQMATLRRVNSTHSSTQMLEDAWEKNDEWYNFRNINPDIKVLLNIDESTYEGGENGDNHPVSWYHDFDGGRAFYTAMGHTNETFENPMFLDHLMGGLSYAMGEGKMDYSKATSQRVPPENRFVKKVLDFNLDEPMQLAELPGRGMLFIERRGRLRLFDFKSAQTKDLHQLELFYGNEDGLLGLAVDPNYEQNNWIYLFYSVSDEKVQRVSRFTLTGDELDMGSEKVLLTIPVIRECCHSGGGLAFGPDGNLFIGVGDNTNPFESNGFAPIDERPGRALWDAQKSAANTNDLRGKILRIKPEDGGTYSIPDGNLFPKGTPKTRPEIYVMGCRNPFRFSVDSKTGYVYWGDVGPDSGSDDPDRGPKGMGEYNQARQAGFWGWPYTRGNNQVYNDYDFTMQQSGPKFDPNRLINNSPHSTGLQELPPAQPSMIWYSYDRSNEFPWLGEGGVNPMAGDVYHAENFPNAVEDAMPAYFNDKLFVYEWMRDWIYVVTLDENQDFVQAEPFMPGTEFSHPMDMKFGSDGKLYILEYGQKWNSKNLDARLSQISYISGNQTPVPKIAADKEIGALPLTVKFTGSSSMDYDGDALSYEWFFTDKSNVESIAANPEFTFTQAGVYTVKLKVTDSEGNAAKTEMKILAGNSTPELVIQILPEDSMYTPNKVVDYEVIVKDSEDGSTVNGTIQAEDVKVTFTYIPEGEDIIKATIGHQQNVVPIGKTLIDGTDCKACHGINEKVNGPSYVEIAERYGENDRGYLIDRIRKGGSGVWGETVMSAHPQLEIEDIGEIVDYILSLDPDEKPEEELLPLAGMINFKDHIKGNTGGKFILMASYLDKGNPEVPNSSLSANAKVVFKAPKLEAELASPRSKEMGVWEAGGATLIGSGKHDSYLGFEGLDLKGIKSLTFAAFYIANYDYQGGIEIREGSPSGKVLGRQQLNYFNENKEAHKFYTIPIRPSADQGDLYVVFKDESDKDRIMANANWVMLNY
jgi:cytochrome c